MSQFDLQVSSKEAQAALEGCFETGANLKDQFEEEYHRIRASRNVSEEEINKWGKSAVDWTNDCIRRVQTLFISSIPARMIKDAKSSPYVRAGYNYKYENIIKHVDARLDALTTIMDKLNSPSMVFITNGDSYVQVGNDNVQEVKNK